MKDPKMTPPVFNADTDIVDTSNPRQQLRHCYLDFTDEGFKNKYLNLTGWGFSPTFYDDVAELVNAEVMKRLGDAGEGAAKFQRLAK